MPWKTVFNRADSPPVEIAVGRCADPIVHFFWKTIIFDMGCHQRACFRSACLYSCARWFADPWRTDLRARASRPDDLVTGLKAKRDSLFGVACGVPRAALEIAGHFFHANASFAHSTR